MRILAIDYGRKKIGLALADGPLAEPLKVIRFESEEEALEKVRKVVQVEQVGQVVVGISEGKMGEEAKEFSLSLSKRLEKLGIEVVTWDETLSTYEAIEKSIQAGIKRKKRRELEDAYSSTLILQAYLDSK